MNLKHLPWRVRTWLVGRSFRRHGVDFNDTPFIDGYIPDIDNKGRFILGPRCSFRSFRLRQCITVRPNAMLEIGESSFMNDGVNICAAQSIKIGKSAKIGDMVYIYDTDFHAITSGVPIKEKSVSLGNNVWVGAHCMILAGASIGDHSVIGAGSVVTGEIPAKSVAMGIPARVIKTFDAPDDWVRE